MLKRYVGVVYMGAEISELGNAVATVSERDEKRADKEASEVAVGVVFAGFRGYRPIMGASLAVIP